jgi:hypothetical protein
MNHNNVKNFWTDDENHLARIERGCIEVIFI